MAKRTPGSASSQAALVIGISDYPSPDDKLPAVAADIREMAKLLTSKHGTFPKTNVTVLTDKQATRQRVRKALKDLFESSMYDTVFVYLAGHGFETNGNYHFMAYDTTDASDAVSLSEIKSWFDNSKAKRVFLWLDFCHSGGILSRRRSAGGDLEVIRRGIGVVRGQGKVIVAACTSTQSSYESSSLGHGFFTHALLRGLKGEAKSAQGEVTALSLYDFIDHQIANSRQQPVFFGETTGRIVLMYYGDDAAANSANVTKKSTARPPSQTRVAGTPVMLSEEFYIASRVLTQSDGNISLEIVTRSGHEEAAISSLRPKQYGGRNQIAFAVNNDAHEVEIESVDNETVDNKQVWRLKLRVIQRQSERMEMSVNGVSANEIAKMRAGRLLLNEPPPKTPTHLNRDSFVESAVVGLDKYKVTGCVIQEVYRAHKSQSDWRDIARLRAIFLLKMTGTIEHVIDFSIGSIRSGKVKITFRGKRPRQFGNVDPETIEIVGDCIVS